MIGSAMGAAIAGALLGPVIGVAADLVGFEVVFCAIAAIGVGLMIWTAAHPGGQAARRRLAARAGAARSATAASAPACCW